MARRVNIVPHTHWDREWYRPFQDFRMRLVELVDDLLPQLESDPAYAHFMLDGQMAVIDDYLAIRPEQAERLRALSASGRVSVGPWYILMDEFLVSGETMIRDLQLGIERAARFGGAMDVGYLPDMFGHVAQMPQVLRQFGFDHTVVWRGVPLAVDAEAFTWEAPDGTSVRAEYLSTGYSNGALTPDDAKELVARIDEFAVEQGPLAGDPILWMNGTDHLRPQPWLGRVVAEANAIQDDYELVITSLSEHVRQGRTTGLPQWTGELRSSGRTNLLMGVASNRVDVHQAASRTEQALEREAEPLSALYLPARDWPQAFLDAAWLEVIRNAAHDSICACSVDEVGLAVLHRFGEAKAIADGLTQRAVARLGVVTDADAALAVNPSARTRSGLVEFVLPGNDPVPGTQVLSVRGPRIPWSETTRGQLEEDVLHALRIVSVASSVDFEELADGSIDVLLRADGIVPNPARHEPIREQCRALTADGPADGPVRIHIARPATQKVLARVAEVPGLGWRAFDPAASADAAVTPVVVSEDGRRFSNGIVTVEIDPENGTFAINEHGGLGRLVDDGDAGDTYNYCPPGRDLVVDEPDSVSIEVVEAGPLRVRVRIDGRWTWPEAIVADERVGSRSVAVTTTIELGAGEDLVRVAVDVDNTARDHRLRAWFPLPTPATSSFAECAFAIVERGLDAEGGPTEAPMPTYPSRRFVSAGGLTVAHEGLLEYELVGRDGDGPATALALTLLRCTGLISQGPMITRPDPAGPMMPAAASQMLGRHTLRYAVHLGSRSPYAVADDAFLPLRATRPSPLWSATNPVPSGVAADSALAVTGAEVSSVRRHQGRLEVRVFNPTDDQVVVRLDGRSGHLVDLRGRATEPFEGQFTLRPWGIATAALTDP